MFHNLLLNKFSFDLNHFTFSLTHNNQRKLGLKKADAKKLILP